jgi:hypothetical protein
VSTIKDKREAVVEAARKHANAEVKPSLIRSEDIELAKAVQELEELEAPAKYECIVHLSRYDYGWQERVEVELRGQDLRGNDAQVTLSAPSLALLDALRVRGDGRQKRYRVTVTEIVDGYEG